MRFNFDWPFHIETQSGNKQNELFQIAKQFYHISDKRETNKSISDFAMQMVLPNELGETPGVSHTRLGEGFYWSCW